NEVLYTADGKIKRRPVTGGPARIVEFTADVSFTRPAFTPKRRNFDLAGSQRAHGVTHPAVSPDGRAMAFAALGDLWIMRIGGPAERVMHDAALDTEPAWSPDGRSLAFSSDRDGSMNVWFRDLQNGSDRQLTHRTTSAMHPAWSPDGTQMAAIVDGLLTVWAVTPEGQPAGQPRPLTTELAGSPTWTGDSRSILFQAGDRLKLVDVASRRIVQDIDPRLTWTRVPPPNRTTVIHAGRMWDGRADSVQENVDV